MTATPPSHGPRRLSSLRLLLFSCVALILTLGGLEGALRLAGVPPTQDRTNTWFADHILSPPLWHPATLREGVRILTAGQSHHFHPFSDEVLPHTLRVAVLGGSAAHGYGVLEPGSFPHRLEQVLQRALPETDVQVINLGTVAWSSQQLLWAARQIWDVGRWDLIIIYSGNNELLELSSWKTFMSPGEHRRYTHTLLWNQRLGKLRVYSALHRLFARERPDLLRDGGGEPPAATPAPQDPTAEDAPMVGGDEERGDLEPGFDPIAQIPAMHLDSMKALPKTERARMGDLELRYAARTFTHNIGEIVDMAREHGAPVILMNPAANDFQDPSWFPYAGEEGARFEALIQEANDALAAGRNEEVLQAADQALTMHPQDPRAAFAKGQALAMSNRKQEARSWYDLARSRAEYPNRVVPAVSDAIRAFEGRPGVAMVVDIEALFRGKEDGGLIGYDLIYDHCHPSVEGDYVIAGELARRLLAGHLAVLSGARDIDIDAWVAAGRRAMRDATRADPRLWEWTGLDFEGKRVGGKYIADFQGDWRELRDGLLERARQPEATAMDLLWAGDARFYDYDVDGALDAWDEALRLDPGLCLADANRAHAERMVGLRDAALADANAAVACDPADQEYLTMRDLLLALTQ